MTIPKNHKENTTSCLDCHKTFKALAEYPCVIYKVCPVYVPGRFYIGRNGKDKQVRACLLIGKDCNCNQ